MGREKGYYWLLLQGEDLWQIGYWLPRKNKWYLTGEEEGLAEFNISKINEERILPPNT